MGNEVFLHGQGVEGVEVEARGSGQPLTSGLEELCVDGFGV